MSVQMMAGQTFEATVEFKDNFGNAAEVDDAPVWASSDPAVLEVTASADGMSVVVKSLGPAAPAAQVTVSADADLGDGTETIVGTLDVVVVGGEATVVTIVPGIPHD